MRPIRHLSGLPKLFLGLTIVYFFTSIGHFSHNAEFICGYPNLPAWLTRAKVYAAWAAITSVGVFGIFLIRERFIGVGLLLVAVYATLGFDGLGHYSVAPMELHTFAANLTILSEVAAAALLLAVTLHLLALHLRHGWRTWAPESGAYLLVNPTECKHEAGTFVPVIDRNRCEGKGECARVCPVGVYKVDSLPKEMRSNLSIKGKIKGFAHKWQQAFLVNAEACEACGLCIKVCPENAITLARAQ